MDEREIHLRDYLKVIDKRKYIVLTFAIIIFTIVLIGTLSSTPIYKASAKVLIERGEPAPLKGTYYYPPYDPEFYETQYQLIRSASVGKKVVTMLSLESTYEAFFKPDKKGLPLINDTVRLAGELFREAFNTIGAAMPEKKGEYRKEPEDIKPLPKIDVLAKTISGGITVTPVKNSRVVNISYSSPNPEFAALIANTVAKAYREEILEMKMGSAQYTIEWMKKKAEEEKAKLEKSEQALQEYMRSHDIVTLENKIAILPQKLSEYGSQLAKVEAKRKELEALYNKIKGISENLEKAETIPAIASDPILQSLREQTIKAEQNITELSKKFGEKHPSMLTAKGELEILKKKREQEISRIIESLENEYELAKANEASTRRLFENTKGEALNLNQSFIQYEILKRDVESNRQLYDTLIKHIKEQSITEQAQTVDVWILENADIPKSPFKPRKSFNIFLGIFLGLFSGIGIAFFVEYLDNTIKSPEEAERRLRAPVLGMVSILKGKDAGKVVLKEPNSIFSENFKSIRTAILLSSADAPPKSILITSTEPEEGKTISSVNLALTIAQSEYRVLLIDADLRKPQIHKIFGIRNMTGLSTYLAGTSNITIHQVAYLSQLSILPSGPVPPNPSELLSSNRMHELIRLLMDKYNIIICDSPPLVPFADALILSKIVNGTIIVTKAGKTTYEVARKGLKSLRDIQSHIFGLIINAFDLKESDYYSKHYDYYHSTKRHPKK